MIDKYLMWIALSILNTWSSIRNIHNEMYFIAAMGIAADFICIANIVKIVMLR